MAIVGKKSSGKATVESEKVHSIVIPNPSKQGLEWLTNGVLSSLWTVKMDGKNAVLTFGARVPSKVSIAQGVRYASKTHKETLAAFVKLACEDADYTADILSAAVDTSDPKDDWGSVVSRSCRAKDADGKTKDAKVLSVIGDKDGQLFKAGSRTYIGKYAFCYLFRLVNGTR